jgi:hypothetical protein
MPVASSTTQNARGTCRGWGGGGEVASAAADDDNADADEAEDAMEVTAEGAAA